MSQPLADVLPAILSRFEELSQTPGARHLASVSIGPTSIWDAVRYDVADAIYDETYREMASRDRSALFEAHRGPFHRAYRGARAAVVRNLWQAQVGEEFLVGLLSTRLGRVGDLLETASFRAHALHSSDRPRSRVDVLVAGSMYRRPVAVLSPVLDLIRRHHGIETLVLTHDDVLFRHGRAFTRLGLRWHHAAVFSNVSKVFDRARSAVAAARGADRHDFPEVVWRTCLSERHLRRLAVNYHAAKNALSACDPSVVVIPDERQPLARLVGLDARARGLPVISAPLDRDQIYRKMPLWGSVVSTRVFVFSALASRFLARAGASPELFEAVRLRPPDMETVRNQAPLRSSYRRLLGLDARTRIVLFASQGQPYNQILLPMLADATADLADAMLVIRPHPDEWPPLVRLMNPRLHVSTAFTAREAIEAADVLVTHSSFMAVEAALLGCPVILLSHDGLPALMPLVTEGLARWVCTREQLHHAIADLWRNEDSHLRSAQKQFHQEHVQIAGIERVAEVIAALVRAPAVSAKRIPTIPVSVSS